MRTSVRWSLHSLPLASRKEPHPLATATSTSLILVALAQIRRPNCLRRHTTVSRILIPCFACIACSCTRCCNNNGATSSTFFGLAHISHSLSFKFLYLILICLSDCIEDVSLKMRNPILWFEGQIIVTVPFFQKSVK